MTGLKILVISMGFLIVIGIALVGYGLTHSRHAAPSVAETVAAKGPAGYFSTELPVPRGGKLEQMAATGDRLVLRFTGGESERILLLDVHSGQLTGSVTLVPEQR
jgi:hypothetical protein